MEPSEPVATGIGTRWWYWTAPRDGPFTWRLDGSNAFQLTIWTGDALDQLNLVGSLRGGSTFVLDAMGASRYRFALGHSPDTIPTNLYSSSVAISWGETPANDDRADAHPIVGAGGSVDVSLRHATTEASEPRSTVGVNSVWWYWTAPTTGWHRFWVEGHPLSAILSVYPDGVAAQAIDTSEGQSSQWAWWSAICSRAPASATIFTGPNARESIRKSSAGSWALRPARPPSS